MVNETADWIVAEFQLQNDKNNGVSLIKQYHNVVIYSMIKLSFFFTILIANHLYVAA